MPNNVVLPTYGSNYKKRLTNTVRYRKNQDKKSLVLLLRAVTYKITLHRVGFFVFFVFKNCNGIHLPYPTPWLNLFTYLTYKQHPAHTEIKTRNPHALPFLYLVGASVQLFPHKKTDRRTRPAAAVIPPLWELKWSLAGTQ